MNHAQRIPYQFYKTYDALNSSKLQKRGILMQSNSRSSLGYNDLFASSPDAIILILTPCFFFFNNSL